MDQTLRYLMKFRGYLLALGLVLLSVFAYTNSIHGAFHFDDIPFIKYNESIKTLDIAQIWQSNPRMRFLGFFTYAINHHISGFDNMEGWHYTNIILHAVSVLFLWGLLRFLLAKTGKKASPIPWMAAALFAVHPLCSEAVNYIRGRDAQLYSLFTIAGGYFGAAFFAWQGKAGKTSALTGLGVCLLLASLSKEVGLFFVPAAVGAYFYVFEWNPSRLKGPARRKFYIGIGVSACVMIAAAVYFQQRHYGWFQNRGFFEHLLVASLAFLKLGSLSFPLSARLNADHYMRSIRLDSTAEFLAATIPLLILIGIVSWSLREKNRHPLLSYAILWSVLGYLPYILVPGSQEHMVEYKAYLPAMGFMIVIAWAFDWGIRKASNEDKQGLRKGLFIAFGLLVAFSIVQTRHRNDVWETELKLWSDVIAKKPDNPRAQSNLGNAYLAIDDTARAIKQFKRSIDIDSGYAHAYYNLAITYKRMGKYEEALSMFYRLTHQPPWYAHPHYHLGATLALMERYEESIPHFWDEINTNPGYAEAYHHLGFAYEQVGKPDSAVWAYEKAIAMEPEAMVHAIHRLAKVYIDRGQKDVAVGIYNRGLSIHPDHPGMLNNLASIFLSAGNNADAMKLLEKSVAGRPSEAGSHFNLGMAYQALGKTGLAEKSFQTTLRLDSSYLHAYFQLANLKDKAGDHTAAIRLYAKLVPEAAKYPTALRKLGNAYISAGNYQKALETYEKAVALFPAQPKVYNNLGTLYGKMGEKEKAIDAYVKALVFDSTYAMVHENLASLYAETGRPKKARGHRKKAAIARKINAASKTAMDEANVPTKTSP